MQKLVLHWKMKNEFLWLLENTKQTTTKNNVKGKSDHFLSFFIIKQIHKNSNSIHSYEPTIL